MLKASLFLILWLALAYQGQCQFLGGFGASRDDYIRNYLNWRANTGPGQLWPPRPAARRDVEETTERDREPLEPDFDIHAKADIDGSVDAGVIDVDAEGNGGVDILGSDLFPDINDNRPTTNVFTGFAGFPNLFNIFGNFRTPASWWNGYRAAPWWKSPHVCIERQETTENEEEKTNSSDADKLFTSMINLSSCHESFNKYECTTKTNVRGVMKSFTIKYQCCYGYKRSLKGTGCEKLNLKPLPDQIKEIESKEFLRMVTNTNMLDELSNGNYTVFVPLDKSITEFAEDMSVLNQVELARRKRDIHNALTSKDFVLNHIVKGFVDLNDVNNEQILDSAYEGSSIRINFYPTKTGERLVTANCVPVRKQNIYAENGIVHVIDGVMPPSTIHFDDIVKGSGNVKMFRAAWQNAEMDNELKGKSYTILIPTDEAFEKLPKETKEKLLSGDNCAKNILRHHIIPHTVCTSAINGNVSTHNMEGVEFNMERTDDDKLIIENEVEIIKPDIIYKEGVAHLVDRVMLPDSGLHFMQILKKHNYTRFEKLIKRYPNLSDELNSYNSSSFFVPTNEAFSEVDDLLDGENKLPDEEIESMIKYHIVPNKIDSCDFDNNELVDTESHIQARINLYSTLPIFSNVINRATVNCARITKVDVRSCGSVVHVIDKVLVPPKDNIYNMIVNNSRYGILNKIMADTEIVDMLKDDSLSITFLAPTDEALEQVSEKDIDALINDKKKATDILKNHVLKEVLCCSGVGSTHWNFNNYIQTMSGSAKEVSRNVHHQIRIGSSTVTKCDIIATNGVIQEINKIMFPARHSFPNIGLFLFDF